jgi:hypothetical protein
MDRFDVSVSAIEPGNFKSDITMSSRARLAKKGVQVEGSRYADEWARMTDSPEGRSQYKEPDDVARAALLALFDANPKPRYLVVPNQQEARWTIAEAIKELTELNERQPYSYSREQLIEMLNAAIAASD